MKKIFKSLFIIMAVGVTVTSATYAAWTARTQVLSNTFSAGNANLKVSDGSAWQTQISGYKFDDIYPNWSGDYYVAVRNTGTVNLKMNINAEWRDGYTNRDSKNLRDQISVKIWEVKENGANSEWSSSNYLGQYNSLRTWIDQASGFNGASQLDANSQRWYLFRFTANDLGDEYQNAELRHLNFVFDGTTAGATQ